MTLTLPPRTRFLHALDGRPPFAHVGPNWFASVMGTGIVAVAGATLPVNVPGMSAFTLGAWLVATAVLIMAIAATATHWILHPTLARRHLDHAVMSHFYGAPAMGLMTVGAGAILVGDSLIGLRAAVIVDVCLWTSGTLMGLWTATAVPLRMFTQRQAAPDEAFGGWLMPVVPPMVSAATGPLLLAHLPAGQARLTLELACYAMFGLSLLSGFIIITLIWSRLVHHAIGQAAAVPTLWIVLGVLGQSVTAAQHLGQQTNGIIPAPYDVGLRAFALVYGMPVWGFAMLWLTLAAAITMRTARDHLPFSLTWWAFTFPVGTVVTGTSALAEETGAIVLNGAAVVLYIGLLATWTIVAVRTLRGTFSGELLRAPQTV